MRFNVHGGHNRIVPGASALLDEVTEDRKVKDGIISRLRSLGHTAYDCTDDKGRSQGANLANIVAKCNAHTVDIDVSIHLNSGRKDKKGDGKTGGSEVFIYDLALKNEAKAVADAIAEEFGYALRSDSTTPSGYAGVKISKSLYVLANTKAPAMLIECCFVDDKDDAKVWNADRCAGAIVKGLTGKTVPGSSKPSGGSSSSSAEKKDLGNVDITYQAYTTKWWPAVKTKRTGLEEVTTRLSGTSLLKSARARSGGVYTRRRAAGFRISRSETATILMTSKMDAWEMDQTSWRLSCITIRRTDTSTRKCITACLRKTTPDIIRSRSTIKRDLDLTDMPVTRRTT